MLQAHPHAIHFKHILYFGEGQPIAVSELCQNPICFGCWG
jgi:hypothetical protein